MIYARHSITTGQTSQWESASSATSSSPSPSLTRPSSSGWPSTARSRRATTGSRTRPTTSSTETQLGSTVSIPPAEGISLAVVIAGRLCLNLLPSSPPPRSRAPWFFVLAARDSRRGGPAGNKLHFLRRPGLGRLNPPVIVNPIALGFCCSLLRPAEDPQVAWRTLERADERRRSCN